MKVLSDSKETGLKRQTFLSQRFSNFSNTLNLILLWLLLSGSGKGLHRKEKSGVWSLVALWDC